ncbi:FAD-binding oxidoreductase [Candidatus Pacearchaeota archaeon]|nr:FAD-binding oxidoreductase [Candidatus Pacearchaeota archaeon]
MIYKNWLRENFLKGKKPGRSFLKKNISTECLVIGGGIAGLHAALKLIDSGKKVVLLEKTICGGSSSGQSGGFLSPESEEDMSALTKRYDKKSAKTIYGIPKKGVELIANNIKKYKFKCDFRKQDSLLISAKESHNKKIFEEARAKKAANLPHKILNKAELKKIHPGKNYLMGLRYPGSYGIDSFAYCREMKNLLVKKGVKIYEGSEVKKINGNTAITRFGSAKARDIIICVDKLRDEIGGDFSKKYYHLQTYIAISEPLNREEMKSIFPNGELMCWDTNWDYAYYRPVFENRILVGGSSAMTAYMKKERHSPEVINYFIGDLKSNFPKIKNVKFTHYWAGLIDVTKDLVPIADYEPKNKSIQYALGCAGLNWAAYCGDYLARRAVNPKNTRDLSEFLGANRKFFISDKVQSILGKKISFFISHLRHFLK